MTKRDLLIPITIILLYLGSSVPAESREQEKLFNPPDRWAMLQIKYFEQIAFTNQLPAPIPLSDCIPMAIRVRMHFNKTMAWNLPQVKCLILEPIRKIRI